MENMSRISFKKLEAFTTKEKSYKNYPNGAVKPPALAVGISGMFLFKNKYYDIL